MSKGTSTVGQRASAASPEASGGEQPLGRDGLWYTGTVVDRGRRDIGKEPGKTKLKITYSCEANGRPTKLTAWDPAKTFSIGELICVPIRVSGYVSGRNQAIFDLVIDDGKGSDLGESF